MTACACITEIREYVWGVVTEWYGDHFEVSFEPEPVTTEEPETYEPEAQYPTEIERVAKLTYVPEGCYKANEVFFPSQYYAEYHYGDEWRFVFIQYTYSMADSLVDGENTTVIRVQINGRQGLLTEKSQDGIIHYYLIWQDDSYRYNLQGHFSSVAEIIKIAERVSVN